MKAVLNFLKRDEGATFVEMAAVMPFLFILVIGVFEFGNVLYQHHLITTGVRDAARYLARHPGPDPDDLCAGTPTAAEEAAKQIAVTGSPSGGDKRVSWWNVENVVVDYRHIDNSSGSFSDCPDIWIIEVSTDVSYAGLGLINFAYLGLANTLDFTITHRERYMRR